MNRVKYFISFHLFFLLMLFPYVLILLAGLGIQSEVIYSFNSTIFITPFICGIIGLAWCISKRIKDIGLSQSLSLIPTFLILLFNLLFIHSITYNCFLRPHSYESWIAISCLVLFSILNLILITSKTNLASTYITLNNIPKNIAGRISYLIGYALSISGSIWTLNDLDTIVFSKWHIDINCISILMIIVGILILTVIKFSLMDKINFTAWLINGNKNEKD